MQQQQQSSSQAVVHNYHDHALDEVNFDAAEPVPYHPPHYIAFPLRLYDMLRYVEREGLTHIASWAVHGRCFHVRDHKLFVSQILPV